MTRSRLLIDALHVDVGAGGLGVLDGGVVGDDTIQETLSRFRVLNVLDAHIDTFGDDASTNLKSSVKNSRT